MTASSVTASSVTGDNVNDISYLLPITKKGVTDVTVNGYRLPTRLPCHAPPLVYIAMCVFMIYSVSSVTVGEYHIYPFDIIGVFGNTGTCQIVNLSGTHTVSLAQR